MNKLIFDEQKFLEELFEMPGWVRCFKDFLTYLTYLKMRSLQDKKKLEY